MKKNKNIRNLITIVPALVFVSLEIFLIKPSLIYYLLFLINISIFFAIYLFSKDGTKNEIWWDYIILPILFINSIFFYSILFVKSFLLHLIFVIASLFIYFYLKNIYYYIRKSSIYKANTLQNISSYGNFLIMFFAFSSLFGFRSFLNISVILLVSLATPLIFLVIYQVMWANDIKLKQSFIYIMINTLILIELFWAASFLPLSYNSTGLILAICYYILIGITRFNFKGKEGEKKIKFYLIFGLLSILAILLSSNWI